ncbi:hypothetical protein RCL_jg13511.t1 [Rhizophagus clarus]|uniref:Uncharacterized protein n=1 Tax=Rhizophagus clarus TaxID=94130 RepID=A0A8H3LNX6_9GLOM|nr:hypothetical protein RCL_jg13511.t1 [Rhizophagus clarus]
MLMIKNFQYESPVGEPKQPIKNSEEYDSIISVEDLPRLWKGERFLVGPDLLLVKSEKKTLYTTNFYYLGRNSIFMQRKYSTRVNRIQESTNQS